VEVTKLGNTANRRWSCRAEHRKYKE